MTEIITRCPGCSVSFRASPAHLQAANGQVRCGACLIVFDARENEVLQKDTEQDQTSSDQNDDLLIFDEMEPDSVKDEEQDKHASPTSDSTTPTAMESLVESGNGPTFSQDIISVDLSLPEPAEEPPSNQSYKDHPPLTETETETETSVFNANDFATTPDFALEQSAPPQNNHLKKLVWPVLSLLAILVIAVQYVHFHADIFATDPDYLPKLTRFCHITGCKIPVQRDTTQIHSNQLLVHSHPEIPGALTVDAIIINTANFAQPFPDLALSFEDIQGSRIAHRRFKPEEYLRGDLTGSKVMPSQQPIRLMLELIDPGPEAVNYSLYIPE